MKIFSAVLLVGWFTCTLCAYDTGFEKLYESNNHEIEDYPLIFNDTLPSWLRGTYIKNGLGRFEVGHRRFVNAFDTFAKLSSWKFPGNGSCFFSTKFVYSDFYNKSIATNDIYPDPILVGVDPPFTQKQKFAALTRRIDNMNVNIYRYYNAETKEQEYVILNDCWKLYRVEPKTLTTLQAVDAEIPEQEFEYKNVMSSAHPVPEPGTTNHIEYVTSMSLIPGIKHKVQVIRIKSTNDREQIAVFNVDELRYMHSFAVTKNYAVFFQSPYKINLEKLFMTAEAFKALEYSNTDPIEVYMVELKTGKVTHMQTENGLLMHFINAYETDNSEIITDAPVYTNINMINITMIDILHNATERNKFDVRAWLTRFIIDLKTNTIKIKKFFNSTHLPTASRIDMPTINENYRFKEYCYVYGIAKKIDDVNFGRYALAKKDLCGNTTDLVWYVENVVPTEAWFVPRPNGTSEDDGVLLSMIFDGVKLQNSLILVDPKTMKTISAAVLPIRNPATTHGRFFSDLF
ncbi:hypothetical protein KUTeg_014297 [Tegillarca granosa]|uniref:Uncharacterized protein n=1 Tax=Tegillarca granosa TaxID=220873 RepID=A0ABQ9EW97_TEGGR|nr:hypothetical protein KUTeg_014297 [Tegillarca granosa]